MKISVHLLTPIDEEFSAYIEEQTRDQRNNQLWKDLHRGRITSSIFGDVLKSGDIPTSLINRIINGSSLDRYIYM